MLRRYWPQLSPGVTAKGPLRGLVRDSKDVKDVIFSRQLRFPTRACACPCAVMQLGLCFSFCNLRGKFTSFTSYSS
jgi:hypothetical protein